MSSPRRPSGQSADSTPRSVPASPEDAHRSRRRSSMVAPAVDFIEHLITEVGGVNSIDNFARSWTRAAGFHEIARSPAAWSSFPAFDDEETQTRRPRLDSDTIPEDALDDQSDIEEGGSAAAAAVRYDGSDYGTSFNSPTLRLNDTGIRQADRLFRERQSSQGTKTETEPLLVKRVSIQEDSGKTVYVNVVVGQSTFYQTVFNSVNVLIGIGMLSLPLGIRYAGWLIGLIFFFFSAAITNYTAKLLAKCLDTDPTLITYADIAYAAYGQRARIITSIVFFIELVAACVALVVLFADSLNDLFPAITTTAFKIGAGIIFTPLCFMPLRVLSFSSILGIFCCLMITLFVFVDGVVKPDKPGSLREPMDTYMFPLHWETVPLSLGLLMSPWGGHSVFPNIYKDMRHPHKYTKAVNTTYTFTYLLDLSLAVVGYLMFGDLVRDEITSNILTMPNAYPKSISAAIVAFIAIIPLTKAPLNARPIISTIEILMGLDSRVIPDTPYPVGRTAFTRGMYRIAIPAFINVLFVVIAIMIPSFDRIMAFLGSALCFTICVILPLIFYLKIFEGRVGKGERLLAWFLIGISTVMAVVGTVATFIPKERLERGWRG